MRRMRGVLWVGVGILSLLPLYPDTIRLKNGRVIQADSSRVNGDKLEYQIGDDSYAIPQKMVVSVDTGGPISAPRIAGTELPAPSEPNLAVAMGPIADVVRDNQVDLTTLTKIENSGSRESAAVANFIAGKFEAGQGRFDNAVKYMERALHYDPQNVGFMLWDVNILLRMRRAPDAQPLAEHATRLAPDSAEAWAQLGFVYFNLDRTKEAVASWKRAYAILPDPTIERMIARGEREMSAEGNFTQDETGHFTIHYEGGQTPASLRRAIIDTLESHYSDLVRDFGITPKNVSVSLYSQQAYFDVTQAPSWSAALNDGKLRIPISGLTGVDSGLARVLKHELTHTFINQLTHGRCPQWLNEGVAQLEEGRGASRVGIGLARLYASQQQVPLAELEAPFTRLSAGQANIAYAESLAASAYIQEMGGMSDIVRLLTRIGEGQNTEAALRGTLHGGYDDLETNLAGWLKRNYGL